MSLHRQITCASKLVHIQTLKRTKIETPPLPTTSRFLCVCFVWRWCVLYLTGRNKELRTKTGGKKKKKRTLRTYTATSFLFFNVHAISRAGFKRAKTGRIINTSTFNIYSPISEQRLSLCFSKLSGRNEKYPRNNIIRCTRCRPFCFQKKTFIKWTKRES